MSNANNEIAVTLREEFGNNASRRARHNGLVPVAVYGKGKENRNFFMKSNEWEVVRKTGDKFVLVFGDEKISVIAKEEQINFMKSYVVHVDFQEMA